MQSTEQPSIETVDELAEQLMNLRNQYEELERINKQLLLEKEDLNSQLNDRSIVVGHHSAFKDQNEIPIESKQEVC
jgi:regulator of replication initiation timing